ncbi:beta strand repeat-containing protein [Paraburkholderia sacchari]|uniref:beta strand repeat-containing protein n=2 Tax=Paraburkholderia sacchari TaxID=159450 RepID=UPI001BCB1298|nr:hemagglutinin repeat-containing protein [Paraburkholderia sacchari]
MNQSYRLVFSRVRNMLVAVEETATAAGKRGSGEAAVVAGVATAMVLAGFTLGARAQIAPGGANAPGVIQTQNGLDQVNINRPSGAGVSVNTYNRFDVQQRGAILNNSPTIVQTQQAGMINGNPNFAPGQSARIIVNQVNGPGASQLNGHLEVAGNRAEVVIANPSGIAVNGGGFINTSRAILTTGTPNYAGDGSLSGFNVTGGNITVSGAGLNASNVDQVDFLSRAVQANAAIYAKNLNVVTGANRVDHDTLTATPIAGDGPAQGVSIDVSHLGGMYANRIVLVGTELGVGVSTKGVLAAQAGDLVLTSAGKLVLAGQTSASGNIGASAHDGIDNSGTTYAQQDLSASTGGTLANSGTLAAQRNVSVNGGSVASGGTIGAGVNGDGAVTQAANLSLASSGALTATGHNVAGGDATLSGASINLASSETATNGNLSLTANAGDLNLSSATTSAHGAINAQAAGALVNDHGTVSGGAVTLDAGRLSNQGGKISAQGSLNATAAGDLSNQGGQFVSQGAMQVRGGAVANNQGTMQSAAGFSLFGTSLDNTAGRITSLNGDGLNLGVSGALLNGPNGVIGGNGNVLASAYAFTNAGQLTAQMDLSVSAQSLDNRGGSLAASGNATVDAGSQLTNSGGVIEAGQAATVRATSLDNSSGTTQAAQLSLNATNLVNHAGTITQTDNGAMNVAVSGALDNSSDGTLQTNSTDLTLSPATLNNDGGTITHAGAGTLTIDAGGGAGVISNARGMITGNGKIVARAGSIDNASGAVVAQSGIAATVGGALNNANGKLLSNTDLSVASGTLTNDGGRLGAGSSATIRSGSMTNNGGSTIAQKVVIATDATLDNSGGDIEANQLALRAANLVNHGGAITQYGAALMGINVSGTFDNSAGGTLQTNSTDLTLAPATFVNDHGTITHAGNGTLTITARSGSGSISNAGGTIAGNGKVVAQGGVFDNATGSVVGQNGLVATVGGALDNTGGKLLSNTDLSIASGSLANDGGQLGAGSNATIRSGSMTNNGGSIVAPNLAIATDATLDNSGGDIEANQLALRAANLVNHGGAITQYGAALMGINISGMFDNSAGGTLQTNSTDLTLAPATFVNDHGTITHAGTGTLTINAGSGAGSISNAGGTIASNGRVVARGGVFDNAAGSIIGQNGLAATVGGALDNTGGKLLSNTDLSIASGSLVNDGGQLGAGSSATIHTGSMTNSGGAIVAPSLAITTDATLDNDEGDIEANQLALNATNLVNHGGTITQYGAALMGINVSGTFDNSAGGTLQTNSTAFAFAVGALNNNGGTILDAGTGTFTLAAGQGNGAFSNVGGRVIAAGRLVTQAGSLDNTSGVLAARGSIAATIAGDVNNAQGVVRSLSSASLASGSVLTNTHGQIQSGTGAAGDASTLAVQATRIDNAGGLIGNLGTGDTTVQGGSQVVNSGGQITGNGNVGVNASSISNTDGGQISGANVATRSDTLDNTNGAIGNVAGSNGDVTVTNTGAIDNTDGQIGSTHDLAVSASTLTGGGAYSAANDVAINLQGDFAPTPEVRFNAGHDLTFALPGTFTNAALLEAANNLGVNAGDIVNSGTMMAGGTLGTHSNTLENTGVMVGGSVSLNATQTLSNLGPTALIGATDSEGTLELLANDIENRDDTTATDTQASTAIYGLGKVVLAGGKDASGNYTRSSLIRNQSGLIEAAGDMELHADEVTNTRRVMTTTGFNQAVDSALLEQLGISLSGCTATYMEACAGQNVGWTKQGDPNLIGGVYIEPPHAGQWNSGYQYTTYRGAAVANLIAGISPQAQIVAGGNLDTTNVGLLQNYWSAVASAGDIAAPVMLDQNSWRGQAAPGVQVTYSGYYHYNNYDNTEHDWTLPFGDAPFVGKRPGGYTQAAPADIREYALPSYESSFVAGGTLSGTGISIDNAAGNAGIPSLGLAAGQALSGVEIGALSGSASGTHAGGASSVSGSASGANAGAASSVSGNAGGTKSGATHVEGGAATVNPVIASATAVNVLSNLTIPQGGLFRPVSTPGAGYLIETNPAFTNQKSFISSDYYLQQIGLNPQTTQKRLGDGFYEQQLVRNQITSLTGTAMLGPYTDLQSMYEALLTAGASLSKSLDLPIGISLSPEQVAALTSNVIVMQTQIVDGQPVLVPVVYLAKASQQNMNGPLIAATDIDLRNAQTFTNSGTVQAGNAMRIDGQSINNAFGALQSGGLMSLTTEGNVDLTSARVNAGSLALNAGGNVLLDTATKTLSQISPTGATRVTTTLGPLASLNVAGDAAIVTGGDFGQHGAALNVGGNLGMSVGGNYDLGTVQTGEHKVVERANGISSTDINQVAGSTVNVGGVSMIGVGGDLTARGADIHLGGGGAIAAKGNVTLDAAKATSTVDSNSSGSDGHGSYSESMHRSSDALTGTTLNAGDSLAVVSGKDINVMGSTISLEKGTATLAATGDVNIGAATQTHVENMQEQHSHSNVVSGKEVASSNDSTAILSQGSLISADSVSITGGHDINVAGSTIVGTNDVSLSAVHDVNITTTQDTMQSSGTHQEKTTGLGTSGLTVTVGSNKLATTDEASSVTNNASTVGSIAGNLSIQAGNTLHVTGSDLVAGGDVTGVASNIIIDAAADTAHQAQSQKTSSSGLTIGLSGSVGDAINNAYAQGKAIGHSASSGNDRAAVLHTIAAGGDALMAGMGAKGLMDGAAGPKAPGIGVQVSVGSSRSASQSSEDQAMQRGSNVQAGGTAAFVATGDGTPGSGNVTIAGSNVSANDVLIAAKNQVNVINTTDKDSTRSSNSSSSASAGVSFGTQGFGVSAAMSNAHGDANSDARIQNASHVNAANSATIISGGDTNIIGSQVNGKQVTADVGGNLNIQSVQDTTTSAAHQSSVGGGLSISQGGGGSASITAQYGHADGDYAQVNRQAGINAGDGGFNVNVKGSTDLKGGVISSTAEAEKNTLTTGTLTFSDMENKSHYSANSIGGSVGLAPGATSDKAVGPASVPGSGGLVPMIGQNESGDQSATTRSAVSAGTIHVTDGANQKQDIETLSRDTTNTNGKVANAPDVNDILNQQADTMQAAQAAGQVVAQGIGAYAEGKKDAADKAAQSAWESGDMDAYKAAVAESKSWAEGGDNRTALHIAGGALIGGLGGGAFGAIGGAAGAGLTAKMADQLDQISKGVGSATGSELLGNIAANVVAGVGGALVGGGAGAATASNVELYNQSAHRKKNDLVAQVCPATGQCNETVLNAAIQAQGDNAAAASENMKTAAIYGAPAAAVIALGPEAVTAAALAGGLDYAGSVYSYATGLTRDAPSVTNSYIAGVVGGLTYPLAIGDTAIAGMGTAGKIAANAYNAGVTGVGAFGTTAITGGNPDLSAGVASVTTAAGSWAKVVLPSPLGNLVNQIMQGAAGPIQNVIQPSK